MKIEQAVARQIKGAIGMFDLSVQEWFMTHSPYNSLVVS